MWNRISQRFGKSAKSRDGAQAHMTFGQTSIGRTMSRTGLLLKKQLWIWPIIAFVLLATIGYLLNASIRRTMENTLRSQLQTLLSVERAMLENWLHEQESSAESMANNQSIRQLVGQLLESGSNATAVDPTAPANQAKSVAEIYARLNKELEPGITSHDFMGYIIADKQQRIVAATATEQIGQVVPEHESFLTRALEGKPTVSVPYPSVGIVKDAQGKLRTGAPTMFACAPVRDENLQIVAVLGLRIRPEKEFTRILQLGRIGETGETYAIDKNGLMVSNSRFDDALILLGLLPDDDQAASILKVLVRNPGGNMAEGFRPGVRRRELPLTDIAAAAVTGSTGVKIDGYRDYRGSPSVGAWTWLPEYQMGIITEIDTGEAFRPLTILRWTFFSLFALLGISAVAIFVFTVIVARLRREAQKAEIEAKQLGQYRLQEKIGAGAMGVVYKGQHAMLRRPTAIKMLDVERVNEASIQRFEREVQITCNLNNPHTVAIYDYGRTPEGVFYYAMEYLDGVDLQTLVDVDGPQPEGRVVNILRQVCSSLYEAHSMGMVHRDIKPANIMLNRRGAEPDVVKVLDFGLVKALDDTKEAGSDMSGTPLYMSPEAIQTPELVDPRSDLYAVGAVGYFLLTGVTAFSAQTLGELCQQHVAAIPDPPSQKLGRAVSAELEHAILACLEKNRAKRPQTARDLAAMLSRVASGWSLDDAEAWWSRHERGQLQAGKSIRTYAADTATVAARQNATIDSTSSPTPAQQSEAAAAGLDSTMLFNPEENGPASKR
ncbi:MAG: serine/threonine protein kinase [Pirellulales bacterium]